jgi:dsRNA-specific ribonuclease
MSSTGSAKTGKSTLSALPPMKLAPLATKKTGEVLKPVKIPAKLAPLGPVKIPPKTLETVKTTKLPPLVTTKTPAKLPEIVKKEVCPQPPPTKVSKVSKDPRNYLNTYFGVRNGIEIQPKENVNYNVETLTYMTSHNRADQITNLIISKMKEYGQKIPFSLFECCAGIGGNTLSFLDNKNISKVTSYECDLKRREMLKTNVKMYKLEDKFVTPNESFESVIEKPACDFAKSVIFFDPPWLTSEIKGHEATKEQYILSGIKVGSKTLEEWAASFPYSSLITMKVPLGYKLEKIENFRYEEFPFKNSLLIILKPDPRVFVEDTPCILENIKKSREEREKEFKGEKEQERQEEKIWKEKLRNYLRNQLLPNIVSDPKALDKLTNDEAMKIWSVAFTHESYNPNVGENYEELELYGDEVMAACYVKFLMYNYPGFTRSQLSNLRTHYISKPFQAPLSRKLGMGNYVRTLFSKSTHVYEDVLEAFFGALEMVGDKVFKFGSGMGLAYNMIIFLYGDVEIERVYTLENPKTRVKELFEKMGWINPKLKEFVPEEVFDEGTGIITFVISLTSSGVEYLKNKGVSVTTSVIAKTTASTKKLASDEAYIMAIKTLESYGLELDATNKKEKKGMKGLDTEEFAPYVEAVQNRLKTEGYVKFYFFEHHGKGITHGTTAKYIQMIGVNKEGRKVILESTKDPVTDIIQGKKELLTKYANYE